MKEKDRRYSLAVARGLNFGSNSKK